MSPYIDDPDFTLHVGDALATLQAMPAESVHCCVTSPPYWGLRDYGTGTWEGGDAECDHATPRSRGDDIRDGDKQGTSVGSRPNTQTVCKCGATRVDQQLGLEPTPDQYVANMVAVFREVRRVLRADGTLWLNIGDSYNANVGAGFNANARIGHQNTVLPSGLPAKNLVGIPWRLAFALQADGWYLRSDIIWSKPNPMPESVTDRPTKAHEYLFLLTRSPRYFYDADAIREEAEYGFSPSTGDDWRQGTGSASREPARGKRTVTRGSDLLARVPQAETLDGSDGETPRGPDGRRNTHVAGANGSIQHRDGERWPNAGRNKRSVWEIPTAPYPDAHFATFPQALVEPCVKAGTSEHGCCPECGAPWERETSSGPDPARPQAKRALEIAASHGLTPDHIAALQACGISDTGKALVTTHGTGRNLAAVQALADEARVALKGYSREFLIRGSTTTTGWAPTCNCLSQNDLPAPHTGRSPSTKEAACTGASPIAEARGSEDTQGTFTIAPAVGASTETEAGGTSTTKTAPSAKDISESSVGSGRNDSVRPNPVPCVVLDPFLGSGTTAQVARRLGRKSIGIELNQSYAELCARRLQQQSLFA